MKASLWLPLFWMACSRQGPLVHYRPDQHESSPCTTAGSELAALQDSPLGFSATDVLARLRQAGGVRVSFPAPPGPQNIDLAAVSYLHLEADLLRKVPAEYVEGTANTRSDCQPFPRYLKIPLEVRLSDPRAGCCSQGPGCCSPPHSSPAAGSWAASGAGEACRGAWLRPRRLA